MTETRTGPWTVARLEALPESDWDRFEIVDGELHLSRVPGDPHQRTTAECIGELVVWNRQTGLGAVLVAPGILFSPTNAVQPDLVWVSHARLAAIEGDDDHLHGPPELIVEVLSPGPVNEERDRATKLQLYSPYGVDEYWIVDPRARIVEVYRQRDGALQLFATLGDADPLTSPLLPGFALRVALLFPA